MGKHLKPNSKKANVPSPCLKPILESRRKNSVLLWLVWSILNGMNTTTNHKNKTTWSDWLHRICTYLVHLQIVKSTSHVLISFNPQFVEWFFNCPRMAAYIFTGFCSSCENARCLYCPFRGVINRLLSTLPVKKSSTQHRSVSQCIKKEGFSNYQKEERNLPKNLCFSAAISHTQKKRNGILFRYT